MFQAQDGLGYASPNLNFSANDYVYCQDTAPPVFSSSGNQLTLEFRSYVGSTAARGFQIQYSSDEPARESALYWQIFAWIPK